MVLKKNLQSKKIVVKVETHHEKRCRHDEQETTFRIVSFTPYYSLKFVMTQTRNTEMSNVGQKG